MLVEVILKEEEDEGVDGDLDGGGWCNWGYR